MNAYFKHPTALVETEDVGEGTRIWAMTHIMPGVHIGKFCNIGSHCFLESGVWIGDRVTIKNGNMLWEGVTIEDDAFIGPQVVFTNDLWPRSPRFPLAAARYETKGWLVPTHVGRGATLGAGAVILAGSDIGRFALVGAGSVVTRPVPAHALVFGNPARFRGWVCECAGKLSPEGSMWRCTRCGRIFEESDSGLRPVG
ncbi:MAG: N-acetyltransferase [candidate division KSB1 bacterium]|nr:N-acetyltransferase [candidate division KSB1 bacterium]